MVAIGNIERKNMLIKCARLSRIDSHKNNAK